MKRNIPSILLCGAGLVLAQTSLVQAQNADAKADATKEAKAAPANTTQIIINGQSVTPEQIKQMQVRQEEQRLVSLRTRLTQAGFAETPLQDTVVAFVKNKEAARANLQEQWQELQKLYNRADAPDTELIAKLYDFQAAADDEKARRTKAAEDLSAEVGLEQKPRLKFLLISLGIIGDETSMLRKDSPMGFNFPAVGGILPDIFNGAIPFQFNTAGA